MPSKPLEELYKEFPDEWLLIRVTKTDRQNYPLEGEVIFHSLDRKEISKHARGMEGDLLITFGGPIVPPGMEILLYGDTAI
jgi:hypothetical protein